MAYRLHVNRTMNESNQRSDRYGFWYTLLGLRLGKKGRIALWLTAALIVILTWPPFYWATPIMGKVVDAKTRRPLDGVIVVAHWPLYGGIFEYQRVGAMAIIETTTDENGEYSFSWRHPRLRPLWGWLSYRDPQLLLFKPGYEWRSVSNQFRSRRGYNPVRTFDWNGKEIDLRRFDGSTSGYLEYLGTLQTNLSWAYRVAECEWTQIPRMITALERQKLAIGRSTSVAPDGIEPKILRAALIDTFTLDRGVDPCGAKEYFNGLVR